MGLLMQTLFWIGTVLLYVSGSVIGIAFIGHFRLMRRPLPQLRYNYHVALRQRRNTWIKTQLCVAVIYLLFHGQLWDLALVFKYQHLEVGIMAGTMLLTAGFLQAVAWAVARYLIERPRPGDPTVLKA